jgi:putative restriction endonuclease
MSTCGARWRVAAGRRMAVNLVVAVTDDDRFEMLPTQPNLTEVNFGAPSASNFLAPQPGELFLFKLHSPRNVMVGGGVFASSRNMPFSLAGRRLAKANDAWSAVEVRERVARYHRVDP